MLKNSCVKVFFKLKDKWLNQHFNYTSGYY
jgi:hypothetical protein